MDSLVYQKNSAIVTDSLTIAKVFQKRHDKVLRDIKNLSCSEQFKVLNFGESKRASNDARFKTAECNKGCSPNKNYAALSIRSG